MTEKRLLRLLVPLGIAFLLLVLLMPRSAKFAYDYRKGRTWKYETLYAQFDFPIYKTEEQMLSERGESSAEAIPYYKYSDEIVTRNLRDAERLELGSLRSATVASMRAIYQKGVMADEGGRRHASPDAEVIYIQRDKRAVKSPAAEVYRLTEARTRLLSDLSDVSGANVDSLLRASGAYDLLVPNLLFDEQTTALVHAESSAGISPTSGYVNAGQLIVRENEIVTAEIAQMLDSYKREFEANMGYTGPPALMLLGNVLIALAVIVLLYLSIFFNNPKIFDDSRYPYLVVVFLLGALVTLILVRVNEKALLLVPFTLVALLLQAFMRNRVVVPVYVVSLLPLLIFSHDGAVLFVMFFVAGMVAILAFRRFSRGWQQFITALITFAVLAVTYLGFRAAELVAGNVWMALLSLFIGSMLTVAGYPLIYLFERLFNLVSNSRLVELCDVSNPLIRELEQKAPGTFQHSLQVMNMADAVARAVDANADLVRAGAMYHDIGKLYNPLCFVERIPGRPRRDAPLPCRDEPRAERARYHPPCRGRRGTRPEAPSPRDPHRLNPQPPRHHYHGLFLQSVPAAGRQSGPDWRVPLSGLQARDQGADHPDALRQRGGGVPDADRVHAGGVFRLRGEDRGRQDGGGTVRPRRHLHQRAGHGQGDPETIPRADPSRARGLSARKTR